MNISDEDIHNSEGGVALNPFVSFLMAPFYFLAPQWYLRVDAFFVFSIENNELSSAALQVTFNFAT